MIFYKYNITLVLLCGMVFGTGHLTAQRFSHQIGVASINNWELPYSFTAVYPDRPPVQVVTQKDYLHFFGLYYHPSVRLYAIPSHLFSLSAGVPISTSFFLGTSSKQGTSPNNYLILSLPLQLEANIGAGYHTGKWKFGGYLGIGAGLQWLHTRSFTYYDQPLRVRQINSYLAAGVRFRVGPRLVQVGAARAWPFASRVPLGLIDAQSNTPEIWFPRSLLRASDFITISLSLGKKYPTE